MEHHIHRCKHASVDLSSWAFKFVIDAQHYWSWVQNEVARSTQVVSWHCFICLKYSFQEVSSSIPVSLCLSVSLLLFHASYAKCILLHLGLSLERKLLPSFTRLCWSLVFCVETCLELPNGLCTPSLNCPHECMYESGIIETLQELRRLSWRFKFEMTLISRLC